MGTRYLIDTNAVCDYIGLLLPERGIAFLDLVVDLLPNISIITQIELLSWIADARIEAGVSSFIKDCNVVMINDRVIAECVRIRRQRRLKLPDALIAAAAIAGGLTLITRNVTDFDRIPGLDVINPWTI